MSTDTLTPDTEAPAQLTLKQKHERMAKILALKGLVDDAAAAARAEYARDLLDAADVLGTKSFIHRFSEDASATFTLGKTSARFTVTDRDAFTEWVETHVPSEVETVTTVRPAFEKELLKTTKNARLTVEDGQVIDTATGLIVDGLTYTKGGETTATFTATFQGDGKRAAIRAALETPVTEVLAITAGGDQ